MPAAYTSSIPHTKYPFQSHIHPAPREHEPFGLPIPGTYRCMHAMIISLWSDDGNGDVTFFNWIAGVGGRGILAPQDDDDGDDDEVSYVCIWMDGLWVERMGTAVELIEQQQLEKHVYQEHDHRRRNWLWILSCSLNIPITISHTPHMLLSMVPGRENYPGLPWTGWPDALGSCNYPGIYQMDWDWEEMMMMMMMI